MLTTDRIGGMVFLALSLGYGYCTTLIPDYPGSEFEPVTAKTFPYILSVLGCIVAFCLLVVPAQNNDKKHTQPFNWYTTLALLLAMAVYGLIVDWIGFILATILFLITGYRILGEKRLKVLSLASIPVVIAFWLFLTQALDVYLASGRLFDGLGG
ncbi:tripartite tricarboxylate transporter TctB family protein [Endozoicomonas sp. SM1973]|uniref:Tripartite tricarboxylate transporter TctB family protein n=1 Tax=Spartinivicinus marinus TaxID=2994442 RepID=A0A853HTR1_9GAMM|nr:tripartite tricarboxylate transporter TctB family protein [Spartinivicinus marinus]MCX4030092.1 tripartite tricarboxylate transporter TctB family protein [Spartinivicinus marinus]NYZ64663.1 tripartite tricarboxylate transporter TctB family protein [Spartinivicinus marinus]